MHRSRQVLFFTALVLAVTAVYSNSFHNGFHFDDSHTVVDNPYIRSLHNLPRFFTDTDTFSVLPANRTYRPMVSASLALDYALGHGYNLFWFHLSTFLIYLLQLAAMYVLFAAILRAARPGEEASGARSCVALLATAWYGLHPAMAETVNYIIQRGDIYCAFGVVAALAIYARWPRLRKTGLYLLPFAFAMLSKPPAVVFPVLLFVYLAMFEREGKGGYAKAALATVPSVVVTGLLLALQAAMTPKSYTPSTLSAFSYCITQPYVLLRYFGSLFLPLHLNVDTDLRPFPALTGLALLGFLFVAALLIAAWFTARSRTLRPISYGLLWFLIGSLPTSLYRLSEVENDHRMFLPFIGLVLAVVWAAYLAVERMATGGRSTNVWRGAAAAALILLAAYGYGAHVRNRVWRTDDSLWLDDVQKCPHNGRGLMNYGLTLMGHGDYPQALTYFQRALLYTPNYPTLEINLGVDYGALNMPVQAEQHFQRAIALSPANDEGHYFYGRWLYQTSRLVDAVQQLKRAVQLNPERLPARDLLATAYETMGDNDAARAMAQSTLQLAPGDAAAQALLQHPSTHSADFWINVSLYQYKAGNYTACITAAQQALNLDPNSALAYNNIGAAYAGLAQWDQAVASEQRALHLKPDFAIAKNNLALYTLQKSGARSGQAQHTPEEWVNLSLLDYQASQYQKSIEDARAALRLRPDYAEAYNNIAAACSALKQWDQAIDAAQHAIRLKPDFQLAKNNLAWAQSQKNRGVH